MYEIQVSARILSAPDPCCCCLGEADSYYEARHTRTTGKKVVRSDTRAWRFPCCSHCRIHVFLASLAPLPFALGILGSLAMPFTASTALAIVAPLLLGLSVLLWFLAGARTHEGCARSRAPVVYDGWSGSIHTFRFANREYAELFARQNGQKRIR